MTEDILEMKKWLREQYCKNETWVNKVNHMAPAQVLAVYHRLYKAHEHASALSSLTLERHGNPDLISFTRYRFTCPVCECVFELGRNDIQMLRIDEYFSHCPECGTTTFQCEEKEYRI